jgi:hypothetical protein
MPTAPRHPRLAACGLLCAGLAAILAVPGCGEPAYRPGRGITRTEVKDEGVPAWVNNPPLDSRLIYGVGADVRRDRARAIADAKHDIARQLHIVIKGDGQDDEALDDEDQDDPATGARPRVAVDHLELPGVTVTRQSETPRCLYVQVALNREAWATGLRQRINELDAQIKAVLDEPVVDDGHPIGATARRHQRLLPLVADREEKLSHLEIADPGGPMPSAPITSAAMHEELARLLDRVTVDIVADPALEPILPQLAGSCANFGLRVTQGLPDAVLRLRMQLVVTPLQVDGMERLDGKFDTSTVLVKDARELGHFHVDARASSLTDTVARDRLMRKIISSWTSYLEHDFVGCLTHL